MTLLVLAVLAQQSVTLATMAALFSFLGHEAVIHIGRLIETRGNSLYVPPQKGTRLLDVQPGGPAWQAGLRSGDVILALNGETVTGRDRLYQCLKGTWGAVVVYYFSHAAGENRLATMRPPVQGYNWGLLPVPEENENRYVELITTGPVGRWLQQGWSKIKS